MSRITHITQLGCISCHDLTELGSSQDGWLIENPFIQTSLDTHSLAIANKFIILILGYSENYNFGSRVKIHPDLSPIEPEFISAVEWLVFDDNHGGCVRVLAVGTSLGYFLVFSLDGSLIFRQLLYHARIMKIRVRATMKDRVSSKEVCIVIEGVIARFDGADLQNMLLRWLERTDNFWDQRQKKTDSEDFEMSFEKVPHQLWNVNKYTVFSDAAITGIMPPPLVELESNDRYYCAITVGNDAVISAYRLSENESTSIVDAIMSKVVPAALTTFTSFSKLIWRSDQSSPKKSEPEPHDFSQASPLTSLKDPPRKGEKLTVSPSGTLAAITDSLGRVLLLDIQALVVVRIWKGYRDANCLFLEMLVNKDAASTCDRELGKSGYCLCLAIHAPKKGIVEVWKMRNGPRLLALKCAQGSKIVQPAHRFRSASSCSSSYVPLEVFLLNGDSGQLSVINKSLL